METLLSELGKSGPWALVAGFLLWTVISAWNSDRKQITLLLGEFRKTLDHLVDKIDKLADALERDAAGHAKR